MRICDLASRLTQDKYMRNLQTFDVSPRLPKMLEPLRELADNLWWTWEPDARQLFRGLDQDLWRRMGHNPIRMLQLCRQTRLVELSKDEDYLRGMERVYRRFKAYLGRSDTYGSRSPSNPAVAYFSAEFGFHESLPNYSGGLGILSADHFKTASDLDLNFCGITLLYRHGYFKQQIQRDGSQEAISLNQSFHHLPLSLARKEGEPLFVTVEILDRSVTVRIWELKVGRIRLYLLDTDIELNAPEDRLITEQLYGGDLQMRIRQEMVLGIGGVRALVALGMKPEIYHMNEGHSAFLSLERIRGLVQGEGLKYYPALQVVAASNVFTTHTPVPAGNDAFPRETLERYFSRYANDLGIGFDDFFRLGQPEVDTNDAFSMTILALRTSRHANGVSRLHAQVSKGLWSSLWPGVPVSEIPIKSITNGVHAKTWLAPEFQQLYNQYLGSDWEEHLVEPDHWRRVIEIPDETLWETHQLLKRRLIDFVRESTRQHRNRIGESPEQVRKVNNLLDPEVLTIGFARRFAAYKRAKLLFSDKERLLRLVRNDQRPVQFIFAGKAHPKDEQGKRFIEEVYRFSRQAEVEPAFVFVEDYDTYAARRLCQGVDVWLNTPLRPLEASGTSGMKAALNGVINFSVLDGWWYEGYNGKNGWAIAPEITGGSVEYQNQVDLESLFYILEHQIIPLYYAKPDSRLPLAWIQLMRESIRSVTPLFNTERMVKEYCDYLYRPASDAFARLHRDHYQAARELAGWKHGIRTDWNQIRIESVETYPSLDRPLKVGEQLEVITRIALGPVRPSEVRVQAYVGETENGTLLNARPVDLPNMEETERPGIYFFKGIVTAQESGSYGFNLRVIPAHGGTSQDHELRLITWAVGG
jgi:glycogen phosphorylase